MGGFARRATVVDEIRKDYPNVLVVDAGDFLFASTRLSTISGEADKVAARYVVKGMTLVKYDVANVGPNDLAAGLDFLLDIGKGAGFTIISANIVSTKTNAPVFKTSVVKTVGGVTIGFFGVTGALPPGTHDGEGFAVTDPRAAGRKMVMDLMNRADVIVALLAMDRKDVYDFAAAVPGIDLIITTSQPQPIPIPKPVGTAYLASGDEKGKRLGRTAVVVGGSRPYKITGGIVPIGSLISRNPALDDLEYEYYNWLKEYSPESAGTPPDTMDP